MSVRSNFKSLFFWSSCYFC